MEINTVVGMAAGANSKLAEMANQVGTAELETTAQDLTGAINEIKGIEAAAAGIDDTQVSSVLTWSSDKIDTGLYDAGEDSLKAYGKNLYNPTHNMLGETKSVAIGVSIELVGDTMVSQRIKIRNISDISFTGIRAYVFSDKNDKVIRAKGFVEVNGKNTIAKADIPAKECFMWVSTYHANVASAQVEYGSTCTFYEPYGISEIRVNGEKLFEYPLNNPAIHEVDLMKLENETLKEEVQILKTNMQAVFNVKMSKETEKVGVTLLSPTKQKLILHLHKRANNGYDTKNDIYLPNAEDDFSDIKITNEDGVVLPYMMNYSGDLDIIADARLGMNHNARVITDSNKKMYLAQAGVPSVSEDNGVTWQIMSTFSSFTNGYIVFISADDTLYVSQNGVLYRSLPPYSTYTQVLDISVGYTGCVISSYCMVQHPDGELFVATYQSENAIRVFKSIDNGLTWANVLNNTDYQHIHGIFIDTNVSPAAIYAGVDGGGGVYKTTDKGATWVDLRALYPTMPQATDQGVIYSDASGYRLLGGETSIVGGYAIIKTSDDVEFSPVLPVGHSVFSADKLGDKLFAIGCGKNGFKTAAVYMSEDDGETWKQVYMTSPLSDSDGASDGFRAMARNTYMGASEEQLIIGCQSLSRSPLRVLASGHYAEVIVDVPAGCETIYVEDGYAYTNIVPITNDTAISGDYLVNFDFNENGTVVKESVSGKYFKGDFEWAKTGKHLSNFYPYVINPSEKASILTKSLKGFNIDGIDTSEGITLSLWARLDYDIKIELIRTESNTVMAIDRHSININNVTKSAINFPINPGAMKKLDIVINVDGTSTSYMNGRLVYTSSVDNYSGLLASIQASDVITVLKTVKYADADCIQHFSIRKGAVDATVLYEEYNSYITDNMA